MFSSNDHTDVKTAWQALQKQVRFFRTASQESTSITETNYLPVDLDSVQLWGDFMGHGEVRNMLDNPELQKVLFRDFTDDERAKLVMEAPAASGAGVQHTFDGLWPDIQNQLSLVQQMCAMSVQNTADPSFVVMSDGDCARKVSRVAVRKLDAKPDFASFKYIPGSNQSEGRPELHPQPHPWSFEVSNEDQTFYVTTRRPGLLSQSSRTRTWTSAFSNSHQPNPSLHAISSRWHWVHH